MNADYLAITVSFSSMSIKSLLRRIVRSLSSLYDEDHKALFDGCFTVFMTIGKVAFWFVCVH